MASNNTPSFRYPFTLPKDTHPQVANALRSAYNSLSDLNQAIEALNTKVAALQTPTASTTALALALNGIPNGDQERLNLQSSDSSVVLTDLGKGNVNLAAATTAAAAPWMLGPGIINMIQVPAGLSLTGITSTLRAVNVCSFFLNAAISGLTHLDGYFGCNLGPGSDFAIAFYDSTGALLWQSGPCAVPNTGFAVLSFTVPSLSLGIGTYYYAWTAEDASHTTSFASTGLNALLVPNSTSGGNVVNQGTVRTGVATNVATAGPTFPSTLGVIALPPTTGFAIPMVFFR